jgi:hypothetical protein
MMHARLDALPIPEDADLLWARCVQLRGYIDTWTQNRHNAILMAIDTLDFRVRSMRRSYKRTTPVKDKSPVHVDDIDYLARRAGERWSPLGTTRFRKEEAT